MNLAVATEGEDGPDKLERTRRRVRSRVPHLAERLQHLTKIAALAARGPDPEAALPHLIAAERSLAAFLKLTPHT